jgi:anti-anti-sigma factor
MEMTVIQRDDDITHVILAGRLDTSAAVQFEKSFSDATAVRNRPTIVDMSAIDFMASRGIGLLLVNSKKLRAGGHRMVLLNPPELVAHILAASKMEAILPVAYDLDEALRILRGQGGGRDFHVPRLKPAETMSRPDQPASASAAPCVLNNSLRVTIRNDLSELPVLNDAVTQFLAGRSLPQRATYAVDLAIDELITNVIRYAYVDDDEHLIGVQLAVEGNQIVLRIDDDGMPFDPRRSPVLNEHAEDREIGGLGLILVLDMVNALKYRRDAERNRVEVRIRASADEENAALSEAAADSSEVTGYSAP